MILQMSREEMREFGSQVMELILDHFENLPNIPVTQSNPESTRHINRGIQPIPFVGTRPTAVLQDLQKTVLTQMIHADHPRYLAFVPGPNNFVSVMGDLLASGFNMSPCFEKDSAGPTQIEWTVLDWFRQFFGLPLDAGGICVSGGTTANLTALAVARSQKLDNQMDGAVIYVSDQAHSSIQRSLTTLGFQPQQITYVGTDEALRMCPAALQREISKDRQRGLKPFCVVATAGTTNSGSIDPLHDLAGVCHAEDLWLHVDGAIGAVVAMTEEYGHLMKGIEKADSITFDPHKGLCQPYELGCLIVRDRKALQKTFMLHPEYLKDIHEDADALNLCDYGIQVTRGFRALKLWMSFKVFGVQEFQRALVHGIRMAEAAERLFREHGDWEIVTPAQLGILTFRFHSQNQPENAMEKRNSRVTERLLTTGVAFICSTHIRGKSVLRLCVNNPRTTLEDLQTVVSQLSQAFAQDPV